jgi:fumarylpyruvate hydrolase
MEYVFEPNQIACVSVLDTSAKFPVHRIYCVGQNYADHVREMGGEPQQAPPVFFSKPADAIVTDNKDVPYPSATNSLHYEVELVIALGKGGRNIAAKAALDCVYGYAVGIDFTRRDLQAAAKSAGRPWDAAKGFDGSAPISAINPVARIGHPSNSVIELSVNGELKQQSNIENMIWSVEEIIAELSSFFELASGELIYTGTPAGVSSVVAGDSISAAVQDVGEMNFKVI